MHLKRQFVIGVKDLYEQRESSVSEFGFA